ncbi:hypothetical protein PC128_g12509 [Phytophthora cactorum]|nr:hypothetical protein PC120_g9572 [Phytophthora cactorum]KAG3071785.1 hypothetical protein PC121_g9137 [Phytophthora cactorum]KAG3187702.1 hypothetical protein PC128_g12509 [Phytophthora cactorum]KAG4055362.1 hypothetical protein PC123_g9557 [Phytophthora cactorum]
MLYTSRRTVFASHPNAIAAQNAIKPNPILEAESQMTEGFLDAPVQAQSNNAAVDEIQLLKQTTPAACTSAIAVQNASEPSTTEDCNRQSEINAAIQPFLKVSRLRPQIRMSYR